MVGDVCIIDERSFRRGGRAYGLFGEIVAVPLLFRPSCLRFVKEGEGVEVRLFLLQGFWENMLHLSGLTVMSLYLMSYELKDDSVIFQPCFSCAL